MAEGSEKRERTAEMAPAITSAYGFAVDVTVPSGNRAFNELRTEDKLVITIGKNAADRIVIRAEGENNPAYPNTSEANRKLNRRVEVEAF